MRVADTFHEGSRQAAVRDHDGRWVLVRELDPSLAPDLDGLLAAQQLDRVRELAEAAADDTPRLPALTVTAPSPRRPGKLIGIGLNYTDHADDLAAVHPDEPVFFLKGEHTLIGEGGTIRIPPQSQRTTAEAELALVIGKPAWQVAEDEALDHVAGVVPVLDQTAEDILQRNPRFLVRSKNFPTFLSMGTELVTLDEVVAAAGSLDAVTVETRINDQPHRAAPVSRMLYSPRHLVSFISQVMPLRPGDVICTGTPGAVVVAPGDVVECRIDGVGQLRNVVASGS